MQEVPRENEEYFHNDTTFRFSKVHVSALRVTGNKTSVVVLPSFMYFIPGSCRSMRQFSGAKCNDIFQCLACLMPILNKLSQLFCVGKVGNLAALFVEDRLSGSSWTTLKSCFIVTSEKYLCPRFLSAQRVSLLLSV